MTSTNKNCSTKNNCFVIKKIFKVVLAIVLAILLVVGIYLAYVFTSYKRIEDNVPATIGAPTSEIKDSFKSDESHTIMSYNIGFGAYSQDYTFFMDDGQEVTARSEDELLRNVNGAFSVVKSESPDIIALQEVDINSHKSLHVDQTKMAEEEFSNMQWAEAINYDSSYLFYPLHDPIGKSLSSIMTLSDVEIIESTRRSLPISTGFDKFFDLDRCYTVSEMKVDNNKKVYVYNVHLSAYGADPGIKNEQIQMLIQDMKEKYNEGNYVIASGDFNQDMTGQSAQKFNPGRKVTEGWALPFPAELISDEFSIVTNYNEGCEFPTSRKADIPFDPEKPENSLRVTLDGFIVSDNIEVLGQRVINTEYNYSDHLPVVMEFRFK